MHVHSLYKNAKIGFFGEYIYLCEDIKQLENEKQNMRSGVCSNDCSSDVPDGM